VSDSYVSSYSNLFPGHAHQYRRRRNQRQQPRRQIYRASEGQQPDFDQIVERENLLAIFDHLRREGGKAPGPDALAYDHFTRGEIARILEVVSESIRRHRYRPHPTRPVAVPKGNGRFRQLQLPGIVDRVVAKSVAEAVSPTIEAILLPGVYGFRPNRGIADMLLAMETMTVEQDRFVWAIDDIAAAFPNVRIADVMADFRRHFDDENLLWLVEAVLRGHGGQAHQVGLDQGSALSPVSFNLRAHHGLDLPLDAAGSGNPVWYRWADNLAHLGRTVSEGHQALQRTRELLQAAGLTLKGEDGPPVNLRRQEAYREILGFRIRHQEDRLRYALGRRARENLERSLEELHGQTDAVQTARQTLRGWIAAYGPAFESELEDDETVTQVLTIAARKGFRELGSEAEVRGWLRESGQLWLEERERILAQSDHGENA